MIIKLGVYRFVKDRIQEQVEKTFPECTIVEQEYFFKIKIKGCRFYIWIDEEEKRGLTLVLQTKEEIFETKTYTRVITEINNYLYNHKFVEEFFYPRIINGTLFKLVTKIKFEI